MRFVDVRFFSEFLFLIFLAKTFEKSFVLLRANCLIISTFLRLRIGYYIGSLMSKTPFVCLKNFS